MAVEYVDGPTVNPAPRRRAMIPEAFDSFYAGSVLGPGQFVCAISAGREHLRPGIEKRLHRVTQDIATPQGRGRSFGGQVIAQAKEQLNELNASR